MKKFLIIGNKNAITYKEIFPYIIENNLWLGVSSPKEFIFSDRTITKKVNGLCRWFTNIVHKNHNTPLDLYKRYSNEYPKYDNYDAIEVSKTTDIPMDYNGVIGVPITFLDKYCPAQFEIVDARTCAYNDKQKNKSTYLIKDADGSINGKPTYARICIRKRNAPIDLYKRYSNEYPKFDTFDAINVDKTVEIPMDYNGVMGVPISFLHKYNPEQFEIVGWSRHNELNMDGGYWSGGCNDATINGKIVYRRILIRKRK